MDVSKLTDDLVTAAAGAGQSLFTTAQTFLIPELRQVAARIAAIEVSSQAKEISPKVARELMTMQIDSSVDVLVAMTELTVFEAEKLINAALKAVRDAVNTALGFRLL